MKKHLVALILISCAIFILGVLFLIVNFHAQSTEVKINDTVIKIEVADSDKERRNGLCCRDSLGQNSGMLFVYEEAGDYRFWMKDTRISLDMYWISSEKKITHIEKNIKPESYPKSFGTDTPSQYILETNAGFAEQRNIQVGDTVQFFNF